MDRGAWWATVHRVTRNQTQLKQLSRHAHILSPWLKETAGRELKKVIGRGMVLRNDVLEKNQIWEGLGVKLGKKEREGRWTKLSTPWEDSRPFFGVKCRQRGVRRDGSEFPRPHRWLHLIQDQKFMLHPPNILFCSIAHFFFQLYHFLILSFTRWGHACTHNTHRTHTHVGRSFLGSKRPDHLYVFLV